MTVTLEKLNKIYDEARSVKDIIEKDWASARDFIRGKQLPAEQPAHKPPAVLNLMRPLIERKTAMMTDTKPRMSVMPTRSGDGFAKAAKLLDEAVNAWWDDFGMDVTLMKGLLYAQAFGVLVTQTRWSPSRNDIVVDVIDPHNFYVDPYIVSCDQLKEAEYVIFEETPSLEEIKMRFPKHAERVKAWTPPAGEATTEGWMARMKRRLFGAQRASGAESAIPRTLIRHYWMRDYSYEDVEVHDSESGKTAVIRRRKYPGGRYVVWCHDGIILHDEANPYYDACHPFDMMDWYMDTDTPWGDGEVYAHKNPQKLLNKLAEVIIENTMLMNNAIWVADKNAFPATNDDEGWGQLTNVPGAIVKKRPGTDVRREYPQGVPASAIQMLQHMEQFIESRAGGFPEIMSKGKAGQVQSGLGIEALQMSASAMIRLKARSLEGLLARVGQKIISRIIQFYTNDRTMHILGPSLEFQQFVFVRSQFTEAIGAEALRDAHRNFRFRIVPGSSLSMTRMQKGLVALQLYQIGAVDRQALLETIEFPDWKTVLQRTIKEQMLGIEHAQPPKGKKSQKGPVDRQMKIAGRI